MTYPYKTDKGHVWATYEDDPNEVDIFAYTRGTIHNGPVCINCGYGFCHHCKDVPAQECPNQQGEKK